MKIGIITFHNAHNYGAVLQTFALKTYLQSIGHDVKVINYRNHAITSAYPPKLRCSCRLRDFRHIRLFPKLLKNVRNTHAAQAHWRTQWHSFESFINEVLLDQDNTPVTPDSLCLMSLDVLIAGSDQIWNHGLTGGLDNVYLLDIDSPAKKIFYGASNGKPVIPENQTAAFQKTLSQCHAISTRELRLSQYIQDTFGLESTHVVDPTLPIDRMAYETLAIPDIKRLPENSFVFAYFISEDDTLMQIARYIARVQKLRLIELHYYKHTNFSGKDQRADLGPRDFLYLIRQASYVVTNSFHGSIFSILFHKDFYSVYESDTRKDDLLSSLGITHRHIKSPAQVDLNDVIDYNSVDQKLSLLRKESEGFLAHALNR